MTNQLRKKQTNEQKQDNEAFFTLSLAGNDSTCDEHSLFLSLPYASFFFRVYISSMVRVLFILL